MHFLLSYTLHKASPCSLRGPEFSLCLLGSCVSVALLMELTEPLCVFSSDASQISHKFKGSPFSVT